MPPSRTFTVASSVLWLIRHGESTWNTLGLAQGHSDRAELTIRGQRQAAEVAERFRGLAVRAVYASDLRRAQQTAVPLAGAVGVPVVLDARLRERSLGILEGTPSLSIGPYVTGLRSGRVIDADVRPERGESVRDLYRRAAAFCDDLAAGKLPGDRGKAAGETAGRAGAANGAADGDVVVVAHGGTLRVLNAYLHGIGVEEMAWEPLENARVLRIPGIGTNSRGVTQ
jgi:2,3-bisphosphoglycerate-dependent phosphoglycerate mutase